MIDKDPLNRPDEAAGEPKRGNEAGGPAAGESPPGEE